MFMLIPLNHYNVIFVISIVSYFKLTRISDSYSVAKQCHWPNLGQGSKKAEKH